MAACSVKIVYVSAIIFTRLLLPCWAEGTFEAGTGEYGTQRLGVARPMNTKYLIYSVNPGEGFNLRRDVHMRAAVLVKKLNLEEKSNWILVLPPWPHLYHWQSPMPQDDLPWARFFDLKALSDFVPTIEFEQFVSETNGLIDQIIHLQPFKEGWTTFEEKWEVRPCIDRCQYQLIEGRWWGRFFGYNEVASAGDYKCISVLGPAGMLRNVLFQEDFVNKSSFLLERFEAVIHDDYGQKDYWKARSSMVYADHLRSEGYDYMANQLNYKPERGKGRTPLLDGGGSFLAVHMRRRDYLYAHPGYIPSIKGAANQIKRVLEKLQIKKVFIATDAKDSEKEELHKLVSSTMFYNPLSDHSRWQFGDGGVAIIEQWIAAHAKYFIGTKESTVTYRIFEDRQLLGLSRESTFNYLCGKENDENDPDSCEKPSYWPIVQ